MFSNLENGQVTAEAQAFFDAAVQELQNNPDAEVNWEELYIETPTSDDGFDFNGFKEKIPNQLLLDNGDTVNVTFGVTKSDKQNADQEVATLLIDGIKFALNQANNNLQDSEKITDIYVMATTNGKHGTDSNHYKGTAVDISRINGQKMIVSGLTQQIIELQEAMDDFQNVRENFGPHFKHKFFIGSNTWDLSYNVGGHQDHIHFSVR